MGVSTGMKKREHRPMLKGSRTLQQNGHLLFLFTSSLLSFPICRTFLPLINAFQRIRTREVVRLHHNASDASQLGLII